MARLLPLAIRPRYRAIAVGNTHGFARLCARAGALARIRRPCFATQYCGHSIGKMGNALCRYRTPHVLFLIFVKL